MREPVTKEDLDNVIRGGCQDPDCTEHHEYQDMLFLHSRCHPSSKLHMSYKLGSGVLQVLCAECEKTVMEVAVASNPTSVVQRDRNGSKRASRGA
jgi:hypothetical protein